jgi:hypothetical protein
MAAPVCGESLDAKAVRVHVFEEQLACKRF